jgi:hypothetical protein
MKKLLILISVIMFSFYDYARVMDVSWFETGNSKLNCKRIHIGDKNARVLFANGEKKTIPINLINAYSQNGKVFTKLPVCRDGKTKCRMQFMELIKKVGELSLYKLEEPDLGLTMPNAKLYSYFLYNGDKMHLALDEKSLPNICRVFRISYHYQ